MNYKKLILLNSFVLASTLIDASPRTCVQIGYREIKRIITYTAVGTYVHQNIMTQQDLTKMPDLSVEQIADYKEKLGLTFHNGCTSVQGGYTSLTKLGSTLIHSLPKDPESSLKKLASNLMNNLPTESNVPFEAQDIHQEVSEYHKEHNQEIPSITTK